MYYQAFNDCEINYTDTMGRALIYAIDEQTGDARPVCNLPGCAHDSAACPAWSDGNVTLCYGDGDEVYLLAFYYNDETSYFAGKESIPTTRSGFCWRRWSQVCPLWGAAWLWMMRTSITVC